MTTPADSGNSSAANSQLAAADAANSATTKKAASGPGSRLRNAREGRNMAVSHVASLLRLDKAVIEALEADDINKLPGATFAKGYLRSYGRLLGLDGEVLVAEYDNIAAPATEALKVSPIGAAGGKGVGRWFWLLLLLSAVVALAWFWSKPSEQPVLTESLRSDSSINAEAEIIQSEAAIAELVAPIEAEEQTSDDIIDALINADVNTTEAAAAEVVSAPAEAAAPATEPEPVDAEPVNAEPVAVTTASSEPAAAPGTSLTLIGLKESWVSIRDANEQRVYRNLLKPGVKRTVQGQPPFLVHFGNANGVVIEVDGNSFEHKPWHKADGTARFVLNPTP